MTSDSTAGMTSDTTVTIVHHHHKFDFRRFYVRPSLHQEKGEEQRERKVSWTELFADLFYVVACINLSHQIEARLSLPGFNRFFFIYSFFWAIWASHTMYQSRIRFIGLTTDYISLLHMLGLLGMILHCNDTTQLPKFAASYSLVRISMALLNALTAWQLPKARPACLMLTLLFTTIAALALLAAFLATWAAFVAIGFIAIFLELFFPLIPAFFKQAYLPVHVDHVNERYGLVMMIFLGETVVSLGTATLTHTAPQYAAIAFATVVIYNCHLIYYHTSPDQHSHALRLKIWRGFGWSYTHWLLGACFLMLGAAIRICVASYVPPSSPAAPHRRHLLAAEPPAHDAPSHGPSSFSPAIEAAAAAASHDYLPPSHSPTFHAGEIPREAAWLLCISYAAAMHATGIIRCFHYLFNPIIKKAGTELGINAWTQAWWSLVAIWPLGAYLLPLADLPAASLLAILAAHGTAYNAMETFITHRVSLLDWSPAIGRALAEYQQEQSARGQRRGASAKGVLPVLDGAREGEMVVVRRTDVEGGRDHS